MGVHVLLAKPAVSTSPPRGNKVDGLPPAANCAASLLLSRLLVSTVAGIVNQIAFSMNFPAATWFTVSRGPEVVGDQGPAWTTVFHKDMIF